MIQSEIYNNDHFYSLYCDGDASRYIKLKPGVRRTLGPKAIIVL